MTGKLVFEPRGTRLEAQTSDFLVCNLLWNSCSSICVTFDHRMWILPSSDNIHLPPKVTYQPKREFWILQDLYNGVWTSPELAWSFTFYDWKNQYSRMWIFDKLTMFAVANFLRPGVWTALWGSRWGSNENISLAKIPPFSSYQWTESIY